MKTVLRGIFLVVNLITAVFLTIVLPGEIGFYIGLGLIGLTLLVLFFPKKA
jgi:hypothetical protein